MLSKSEEFINLTLLLDEELWERYPSTQADYEKFNKLLEVKQMVVAYIENTTAGCGCFKVIEESLQVEIKRMYVKPAYTGVGVAKRILVELQSWAKEGKFVSAKLETGTKQPEAISLYLKAGFSVIENYGLYVGLPMTICMEKHLVS